MTRLVTHQEFQADYDKGYNSVVANIEKFGLDYAHNQFLVHYPPLHKLVDMADYYYGCGALDALVERKG